MAWDPDWSLTGKRVSVDNQAKVPGVSAPREAQGLVKLLSIVLCVLN